MFDSDKDKDAQDNRPQAKDEKAKLKETDEVGVTITNCYGRTKYMIEQILGDYHGAFKCVSI